MATPPLSASLVTGLKGANAWRFNSNFGTEFEPRFFCCSSPNELEPVDGKEPVAIIQLTPNPMFTGTLASYDGTDSYDPDGTVTGYSWTFESGCPFISSLPASNVSWSASGTYDVKLTVTDGTGLQSTPAIVQAVVVDPDSSDESSENARKAEYYVATASGVWYTDNSGRTWEERSGALSGSKLVVYNVVVDPATRNLNDGNRVVWIGTACGVYVSQDGAIWYDQSPSVVSNIRLDSPAASPYDLQYEWLEFQGNRLWIAGNWVNGASNNRSWIYYTDQASTIRGDLTASPLWTEI